MWFKVDDQLAFHRKSLRAGNAAMGLWVRAGSWLAGQKRTDAPGVITVAELRTMGTANEIKRLIEAGGTGEPGFLVPVKYHGAKACLFHDWTEYQPLPEDLEATREQWRIRKQRARKHKHGDHTACLPGQCPDAPPPNDVEPPDLEEWSHRHA